MRKSIVLLALIIAPSAQAEELLLPVKTLSGHPGGVYSLSFSSDAQVLVSAGEGGTINLWDMRDFHPMRTWKDHSDSVNSAFYSPGSKYLVSGSDDQTVILRSATDYSPVERISTEGKVTALSQSPDGKIFAAVLGKSKVKILSGRTFEAIKTVEGKFAAFSPDNRVLAVAGADDKIHILYRNGLGTAAVLPGHKGGVNALVFSRDGSRLASGGSDHSVKIWDAKGWKLVKTIPAGRYDVSALAYSPSSRFLAFGGVLTEDNTPYRYNDSELMVWDFTGGKKISLQGHHGAILSLAFSPDGKWLVSGSADKTVKVWDPKTFVKSKKK